MWLVPTKIKMVHVT